MNVIFKKDWFNPDTGKTIKAGQFCDIMEWKAKELKADGIADIIEPTKIVKEPQQKEMQIEEIQDPELDKYTPKKNKFKF